MRLSLSTVIFKIDNLECKEYCPLKFTVICTTKNKK